MKGLGPLIAQKMLDLRNHNLLIGGYQTRTTDPTSSKSFSAFHSLGDRATASARL